MFDPEDVEIIAYGNFGLALNKNNKKENQVSRFVRWTLPPTNIDKGP